jgi:hypothetical protein
MNLSTTTQTEPTTLNKILTPRTLIIMIMFILLNTVGARGQNYDIWEADQAIFQLSNSDAGTYTMVADYPLLDMILPHTYELTLTPDQKFYILTKVKGFREITIIENVKNINMKYLGLKDIPWDDIKNINTDTNTFLRKYNDMAHIFPDEVFDKIMPVIKDRLYALFSSMNDYQITSHRKFNKTRSIKIVSEYYTIILRFDKNGNLSRMKNKDRIKPGIAQVHNIDKENYILYAQNVNNKGNSKKHTGALSLVASNDILAINDTPVIQY